MIGRVSSLFLPCYIRADVAALGLSNDEWMISFCGRTRIVNILHCGINILESLSQHFETYAYMFLVSPKLKFGKPQDTTLYGRVATKFANPVYVASKCQTPIQAGNDPNAGTTCLDIEHAGQGSVPPNDRLFICPYTKYEP